MNELPADRKKEPVSIQEEDLASLKEVQSLVDSLSKYRQEMGRITQLLGNLREEANRVEVDLANKRRSLADKYDLEKEGPGQWALDFENKQFVKVADNSPVIP